MDCNVPRSPFSTRLSGSAKETELRIRSIFQWKKKRPPVWLMALMAVVCLSCGSLVSCQPASGSSDEGDPNSSAGSSPVIGPGIAMVTQYYDTRLNCIEIPTLVPPEGEELDQAASSINRELEALAQEYPWVQDAPGDSNFAIFSMLA